MLKEAVQDADKAKVPKPGVLGRLKSLLPKPMGTEANHCLSCLAGTEKGLETGSWRRITDPGQKLWFEIPEAEGRMLRSELTRLKPDKVFEVGAGTGKNIRLLLDSPAGISEITAIEGDEAMSRHLKERFKGEPRVKVVHLRVEDRLPLESGRYDLCINSWNIVGWQYDEAAWLKEMLRASKTVIFTVYRKGSEEERKRMYAARGHRNVLALPDGNLVLGDCSVSASQPTKSYSLEELKRICRSLGPGVDYDIRSCHRLTWLVVLKTDGPRAEWLFP